MKNKEKLNYKEFMVGNLIQTNGFVMHIVSIGTDYIYADFEGNEGNIWEFDDNNPCEPLPIKDGDLVKMGFEVSLRFVFCMNGVEIGRNHKGYYILSTGLKIEYIHEVQNLVFTLLKKEITIK